MTLRRFELPPYRRNAELNQSALYISQYSEDITHLKRHGKYKYDLSKLLFDVFFLGYILTNKDNLNPALCLT
jgi:hypothetical protein